VPASATPITPAAATLTATPKAATPVVKSTWPAFFTRPRHIHFDFTVIKAITVEHFNGVFALTLAAHLHKREAF